MPFTLPDFAMAARLQSKPHIALVGGVWVFWGCPHHTLNWLAMHFCHERNRGKV